MTRRTGDHLPNFVPMIFPEVSEAELIALVVPQVFGGAVVSNMESQSVGWCT